MSVKSQPCDGDECGDHAVETEHRDQQQQLESAVPAHHPDHSLAAPWKCHRYFILLLQHFVADGVFFDAANFYSL